MVFLQNTNKLCVALWVVLECGIATPAISLHILLSRQNLAIPLNNYWCQRFCFIVGKRVEEETNQLSVLI